MCSLHLNAGLQIVWGFCCSVSEHQTGLVKKVIVFSKLLYIIWRKYELTSLTLHIFNDLPSTLNKLTFDCVDWASEAFGLFYAQAQLYWFNILFFALDVTIWNERLLFLELHSRIIAYMALVETVCFKSYYHACILENMIIGILYWYILLI